MTTGVTPGLPAAPRLLATETLMPGPMSRLRVLLGRLGSIFDGLCQHRFAAQAPETLGCFTGIKHDSKCARIGVADNLTGHLNQLAADCVHRARLQRDSQAVAPRLGIARDNVRSDSLQGIWVRVTTGLVIS